MQKKRFLFCTIHITQLAIFAAALVIGAGAVVWLGLTAGQTADAKKSGRLAIVIDDFGLQRRGVQAMLALDCKLTVAVMPFLAYTEDDTEDALENGKEVILHIPMQATTHDVPSHLGPRPITLRNSDAEIHRWIEEALTEIPEAVGANIHMGTLSSTKESVIVPVMEGLKSHGLFFLDSKTSSESICRQAAEKVGIRLYENDVFLEHEEKNKAYVKKCLKKAMKIAKEAGHCVAIGHVGYEGGLITAEAISEMLPLFQENHVELVFLSELAADS